MRKRKKELGQKTFEQEAQELGVFAETIPTPSGVTALSALSDVIITTAVAGDYLRYNGSHWVDVTINQTLTDLKTVDGAGSGLDADLWDGNQFASYLDQGVRTIDNPTFAALTLNGTITGNVIPNQTDTYDLGSEVYLWKRGYISQLEALVFAENTIQITAGWQIIGKDSGTFAAAVGSSDTQIDFGKAMTLNDFVLIRAQDTGGTYKAEYIKVISLASGTTYNVTRDVAAAHSVDPAWAQGVPFLVLGNTGDGRIELDASSTPRISIIEQGATYNAQTEKIRIGDLNGNWGYVAETYGIALGHYASNIPNLTWDATNGLRLRTFSSTVIELDVSGNASFEGVLNIGVNGGIYQGTGTFASPTTGLKMWNDGGVGRIAGYNGGTLQVGFNTSGKLVAGTDLVLDNEGITINTGSTYQTGSSSKSIDFISGATDVALITGRYVSAGGGFKGIRMTVPVSGTDPYLEVREDTGATQVAMTAGEIVMTPLGTGGVRVQTYDLVVDTGGIYLGRDADPGNGNVAYTGVLKSYKNATEYTGYAFVPLTTPLTSTSWDGDAKTTANNGTIDLSAVFGAPAGIKAALIMMAILDTATHNIVVTLGPSSTSKTIRKRTQNGYLQYETALVPCDSNGDVYFTTSASIDEVWIEIHGYCI